MQVFLDLPVERGLVVAQHAIVHRDAEALEHEADLRLLDSIAREEQVGQQLDLPLRTLLTERFQARDDLFGDVLEIVLEDRLLAAEIIKQVDINENRIGFEPEITAKIAGKCRVTEVPISYFPRKTEKGKKIGFKDGLRAVYCIVKYRNS